MKKLTKILTALLICASVFALGASALELDTAQNADEDFAAALMATDVPAENIVPGKNVFTGTTNALTFSDASDADYFTASSMTASVAETSDIYGSANSALQLAVPGYNGTQFWPSLKATFGASIDRPVALLFDFNTKYLAFTWSAGKTGYIDGGYSANKNYFVRKTNIANVAPLSGIAIGGAVVHGTGATSNCYLDNIAAIPYYKITYDMPAGTEDVYAYALADDDGSGNISLEMTSDGVITGFATDYTLDSTIVADGGENAEFLGWALEDAPEAVVTSVSLANGDVTLVPVFEGEVEELVTYSEEYGELIFTSDLEGFTYNVTNATILGLASGNDGVAVTYDGNTGYRGLGLTEGYFYTQAWAQGGGFEFAVSGYGTPIRYTSGEDVLGTVTIVFNAYNEGTADAGWYDYFKQPAQTSGFAWGDLRSAYSCGTAPVGGWNQVVYKNKWIDKPATIIGVSQNGNRRDVVYGDVSVYVKPSNALWLTDAAGENRKYVIVTGSDYTLPDSFRGEAVTYWTDGETNYDAGTVLAMADAKGKTFAPAPVILAPDTLNVTSIRTTAGKQGMRFAAFVDSARRGFADSYGFIVVKADDVESADEIVFNANADAQGVNEYGVKYVSGTAYNKSNGTDLIYSTDGEAFGDAGKGAGYYFTAVLLGIAEKDYDTSLTVRPYLVKNGAVYYGEAITRSIYEAACALRDADYRGLDEDGRAYVDSIISSVEA